MVATEQENFTLELVENKRQNVRPGYEVKITENGAFAGIRRVAKSYDVFIFRLNQMSYTLCLSYHSNREAALFACLLSGWAQRRN